MMTSYFNTRWHLIIQYLNCIDYDAGEVNGWKKIICYYSSFAQVKTFQSMDNNFLVCHFCTCSKCTIIHTTVYFLAKSY